MQHFNSSYQSVVTADLLTLPGTGWYLPCLRFSDWLLLFREAECGSVAVPPWHHQYPCLPREIRPAMAGVVAGAGLAGSWQAGWELARPGCLGVN